MRTTFLAALMLVFVSSVGCAVAPSSADDRAELLTGARKTLADFKKINPGAYKVYSESSKGVAVFPSVGKGGAGIGGAYGQGVLLVDDKLVGYCKTEEVSLGFQLGGQEQSMIMFFEDDAAVSRFKKGEIAGDASASAVAIKADAAATADFKNGVMTYTFDSAGAMYQATVGGKRFAYESADIYDE